MNSTFSKLTPKHNFILDSNRIKFLLLKKRAEDSLRQILDVYHSIYYSSTPNTGSLLNINLPTLSNNLTSELSNVVGQAISNISIAYKKIEELIAHSGKLSSDQNITDFIQNFPQKFLKQLGLNQSRLNQSHIDPDQVSEQQNSEAVNKIFLDIVSVSSLASPQAMELSLNKIKSELDATELKVEQKTFLNLLIDQTKLHKEKLKILNLKASTTVKL